MKNDILEKISSLYDEIAANYNRIKIIDDYDYEEYTIFYLNKKESFEKFSDLWEQFKEDNKDEDESYLMGYDDIIAEFFKKIEGKVDCFECGLLQVYTESAYELYI